MNLIKPLSILTILITSSFAQTTMCYKQNFLDFSKIETVNLDGGLCAGKKSLTDMKNEGWITSDIKIDGNNYIYILKKDMPTMQNIDMQALENQIMKKLEQKEVNSQKAAKEERRAKMSLSGKNLYIKKCQTCHGINGEKLPGRSRAIDKLNLFDFTSTLRDYNNGSGYNRGTAFQMIPYANIMDQSDINNVYLYLQSINQKDEKKPKSN
jgi:mono/diheme cytochrome c family protein